MNTPNQPETCNCRRCGRDLPADIEEHQESLQIHFRAGYGSVFGDGNVVSSILCQHCLKELLGAYLEVTEDDPFQPKVKPKAPQGAFQPSQEVLLALFKADTRD